MPKETYVDIILNFLKRTLSESDTYSPSLPFVRAELGETVYNKVNTLRKLDPTYMAKYKTVMSEYYEWFSSPQDSPWWSAREAYSDIVASMDGQGPTLEARLLEFPKVFEHTIGWELLQMILNDVMIDVDDRGRLVLENEAVKIRYGH